MLIKTIFNLFQLLLLKPTLIEVIFMTMFVGVFFSFFSNFSLNCG